MTFSRRGNTVVDEAGLSRGCRFLLETGAFAASFYQNSASTRRASLEFLLRLSVYASVRKAISVFLPTGEHPVQLSSRR